MKRAKGSKDPPIRLIIPLFSLAAGYFFYRNAVLYFIFLYGGIYLLLSGKADFSRNTVFFFILLLSANLWTFRAVGYKALFLILTASAVYGGVFLTLSAEIKAVNLLFILLFPLGEIFLETVIRLFPGALLSHPAIELFNFPGACPPSIFPLTLASVLFLLGRRRICAVILLFIVLFLPSWKEMPETGLKVAAPDLSGSVTLLDKVSRYRGIDILILNEYAFNRDIEEDIASFRDIFREYFARNGLLAFGYTKNGCSAAGLVGLEKSVFVLKKHPVIFLERSCREKSGKTGLAWKGHTIALAVCQDIMYGDIFKKAKRGSTLIVPSRVPQEWGPAPRKALLRAVKYIENNGVEVFLSGM